MINPLAKDSYEVKKSLEEFDRRWPQDQNQPTVFLRRRMRAGRLSVIDASTISGDRLIEAIECCRYSIPPSVDVTQNMRENSLVKLAKECKWNERI
jgi:hypothetical protein